MAIKNSPAIKEGSVRVRFAPSPTGPFHIGNLRSALFNFLFAQKYGGKMILRIEDTDEERSEKKWEQGIIDGLKWLGIDWDEGPFYQSERGGLYQKYIKEMLEQNQAYHCFCTPDDLEAQKQYNIGLGKPLIYSGKCRGLKKEEVEKNLKAGKPSVLRFKTNKELVEFSDLVLGKIKTDGSLLGDFVIAKNEKEPLYNLACVIDDFEMKITHVIRGGDHISNTPKQILLAKALGIQSPNFCHLPLVLGQDRSKLSKRHGATFIPEYEEQGYLPEAMVNFLVLLGWSPDSDKEIFSLEDLKNEFSVNQIQKSPAVFNLQKLDWLNGYYIRKKPLSELTQLCLPYLVKAGLIAPLFGQNDIITGAIKGPFAITEFQTANGKKIGLSFVKEAVKMYQERLKKLSEIPELIDFLFQERPDFPKDLLFWKGRAEEETLKALEKSYRALVKIKEKKWQEQEITKALMKEAEKEQDRGVLLWPLRAALSGKKASSSPFEIAALLGKERTLERIKEAESKLKAKS